MRAFKEFLESSTIHGLVYIATTRQLVRLFWLGVVIAGFTGSFLLIQQSFTSWADSPVSTTIETLPITEMDFPKVTVCPPRNSFTNLNYDLLRVENRTLDEETKLELLDFLPEAVYDGSFAEKLRLFETFHTGENYIRDWYWGYSQISLPYHRTTINNEVLVYYELNSHFNSGAVATPHFREPFDPFYFHLNFLFKIVIHIPESLTLSSNSSVGLILRIEYDLEQTSDKEFIQVGRGDHSNNNWLLLSSDAEKYETILSVGEAKYFVHYYR